MLVPEPCEAHMAKASAETHARLELADILRRFGPSYAQTHSVSPVEQRIIDDLTACRTASLGYVGGLTSVISSTVISVALSGTLTTPAVIGIVLNVRP